MKKYDYYVLGGDVGGTNTHLAIAGIKNNKPELVYQKHFESQNLKSLVPAVKEVLQYAFDTYKVNISLACIGGAGPVAKNVCTLTNLKWNVDGKELVKKTRLNKVIVVNDFQFLWGLHR